METKQISGHAATLKTSGSDAGTLEAVFSTFDPHVDLDGDVTLPTAFEDGVEVPLVWSHRWDEPVGKGRIRVERDRAIFSGKLWLDTNAGTEAYRRIKNLGSLQEFSYGFSVIDSAPGQRDGRRVRILKKLQVHEVSPVLKGAGIGTGVLSLKDTRRRLSPGEIAFVEWQRTEALLNGVPLDWPATRGRLTPAEVIEMERIRARANGVPV